MNQYHIHVRGLVQGVGFRPYVYRLANEMGLRGYVDNSNDGVLIVLQSTCIQKEKFLKALIGRFYRTYRNSTMPCLEKI